MKTIKGTSLSGPHKDFKIGELVRLRSGGELMTVEEKIAFFSRDASTRYACLWFDKHGKCHKRIFPTAMLVKEDTEAKIDI